MRHHPNLLSTFALLVVATPAIADTLASEIWAEWQAQSELTGQTLTATAVETETGLTLTDVVTLAIEDGVESRAEIAEIQLVENTDGTLDVVFSEEYRLRFAFADAFGGATNTVDAVITFEGLDIQISGDAGARVYTYAADSIALGGLTIDTPGETPPDLEVDLIIRDLASTNRRFGTDLETMRFNDETRIGAMALLVDLSPPPPEPGRMKFGMQFAEFAVASQGSMITLAGPQVFADGVPPGLDLQIDSEYAMLELEFSMMFVQPFEDQLTSIEINYGNAGGIFDVAFSNSAMSFDGGASEVSFLMNTSDFPVPIALTAAQTGLGFDLPLAAGDSPQEAAVRIGYTDLGLGDAVWGLFDPTGLIPRDPASIVLDARAQLQLFVDLLDLDFENLIAPPGELRSLDVDELRLSVGGAEMRGVADLEFAPGQIVPFPRGSADITVDGANALLDALIAAGLVPEEEAAVGRAMFQGFTVPGDGEDSRATVLEFDGAGVVTSNGLPLPF